jgi:hypothetical protein
VRIVEVEMQREYRQVMGRNEMKVGEEARFVWRSSKLVNRGVLRWDVMKSRTGHEENHGRVKEEIVVCCWRNE